MSPTRTVAGQAEVMRRIHRYSTLRGAERALHASWPWRRGPDEPGASAGPLLTLRKMWLDLRAAGGPTPDLVERLEEVDAQLAALAARVRATLSALSMAEFRATLPPIARAARSEAAALLDFCIGSDGVAPGDVPLVEYLVTLLSSTRERGAQIVLCDPTRVTAAIERLCSTRTGHDDPESVRAARALADAAFEVTGLRDLVPVVRRMRALKSGLGPRLFGSEVLRSAVGYNLAVANRIAALAPRGHRRDDRERRLLEELRDLDGPAPPAPPPATLPRPPSVLDSPGLHSVCEALRERIEGGEPAPGPSAKLAARVDVGDLLPDELQAFAEPLDHGAAPLLRAAVVIASTHRDDGDHRGACDAEWRALEVDPELLASRWIPELASALARARDQLTHCGRGAEAVALERARGRLARGSG